MVGIALAATHLDVAGCAPDRGVDLVEHERLSVMAWTTPPGATSSGTGLRRNAQAAEATWEIAVPMPWIHYRTWIEQRGDRAYHRTRASDLALSFARLKGCDQFSVEVAVIASEPLRLKVTFTARPD